MNKLLSVSLPIFVVWGLLYAEEKSQGYLAETTPQSTLETEPGVYDVREPASGAEDASEISLAELSRGEENEVEKFWSVRRKEVYDVVHLTDSEIRKLNEIDQSLVDVEDSMNKSIDKVVMESSRLAEDFRKTVHEMHQSAQTEKEKILGSERYQYVTIARHLFVQDYKSRTGREIKVLRW